MASIPMIELILNKIKVDETRGENVIVFREKLGSRFLPIVIGMAEIQAIKLHLGGVKPPRPLTHDLILEVMKTLQARLESVWIDHLDRGTFFAKLNLVRANGERFQVDARPSDGAALAIRAGVPVLASEEVLGQAAVTQV